MREAQRRGSMLPIRWALLGILLPLVGRASVVRRPSEQRTLRVAPLGEARAALDLRQAPTVLQSSGRKQLPTQPPVRTEGRPKDATKSLFDTYFFVYWSCVAVLAGLAYFVVSMHHDDKTHSHRRAQEEGAEDPEPTMVDRIFDLIVPVGTEDEGVPLSVEVDENMWALVLVVALGNAKTRNGYLVPFWIVVVVAVVMGCLQMAALAFIMRDVDPLADTLTETPSSPHGSVGSVNAMKVVMAIIMLTAITGEAGQCQKIWHATLVAKELRVPRYFPQGIAIFQYAIAILTVFASISVILSFQSVPDIVYSSMSILCITGVDEIFYNAFQTTFKFNADFELQEDQMVEKGRREFSLRYHFFAEMFSVFPILFGMFLFSRAWYTGIMPTDRFRAVFQSGEKLFLGAA